MGRQCLVFTGRQVLVMLAVLVPGWPGGLGWRAIWCPRRVARGLAWGSVGCGFAGRGLGRDPWGWAGVRGGAEEGGEPDPPAGGSPPRPARPPAPRTRPRVPERGRRTAAPTRALSYKGPPARPPPAGPRRRPRRSPSRSPRPHPAARPARTPAAGHESPGSARSAAAARRSSGTGRPPGHTADTPTRTPAARRTTGNPGAGTPPRGQPPHTHRPIAGTAIRWPRATHRL